LGKVKLQEKYNCQEPYALVAPPGSLHGEELGFESPTQLVIRKTKKSQKPAYRYFGFQFFD
jgi:hypothetical protein